MEAAADGAIIRRSCRREESSSDHCLRLHAPTTSTASRSRCRNTRGKVLLIVNVASQVRLHAAVHRAGKLWQRLSRRAAWWCSAFPCDQFGHQEPGDEAEIKNFCSLTYDVDFPMFAKIEVNGGQAHPLWQVAEGREGRLPRHRCDQVELHQVPGRPRRQGGQALCADRHAGIAGEGHRGGVGVTPALRHRLRKQVPCHAAAWLRIDLRMRGAPPATLDSRPYGQAHPGTGSAQRVRRCTQPRAARPAGVRIVHGCHDRAGRAARRATGANRIRLS